MLETPVNRLERDLQLLSRTSALLNAPLDWEKAVHQVIRLAAEALGGTVLFMIRDADQRSLQIFDYHHPDPAMRARYAEFWSRHPVAFPHGPTSQAMAAARTILIDTADPPPGIIEAYRAELGVEWYMAVPILSRGETLGMLGVHSTDRARPFS